MMENGEQKKCPVDRGKVLIGLECCRFERGEKCMACPYYESHCDLKLIEDATAYIGWLEEQMGVTG